MHRHTSHTHILISVNRIIFPEPLEARPVPKSEALGFDVAELFYRPNDRDARLPFFNIRILSISVKTYLYPYPICIRGSIMVQLHCESKNFVSSYVGDVF